MGSLNTIPIHTQTPELGEKQKEFSLFAETNRGQGTAKAIQKVGGGHGHRAQGSRIFL